MCTDELISTLKIMTILPKLLSGNENCKRERSQYHNQYMRIYQDKHFLVILTAPNKQSFRENSVSKLFDHISNS